MIFLALLAQVIFSWSKEVRVISFPSHEISYCGKVISWISVLPQLVPHELECMDAIGPLGNSNLFRAAGTEKLEIDRTFIVNALKKSRAECFEGIEWLIPSELNLKSQTFLNETVFTLWLQNQIQLELPGRQIEINKLQLPRIECAKVDQIKWAAFRLEGKNTFRFFLMADDKKYGVTGEFRVFQKIPVVLRNYSPNEKLNVHDIELQRKDITFSPGYVSKIEDLVGRTLTYPVSQGEPIQIRHLKAETPVEKGQIIQVQYQGDNFIVSSSAIAEQSGSVGDYVKLKNLDSQKTFSGVVLGKGLVEVQ